MTLLDDNVVALALKDRGVSRRDRERVVAWWLFSKPGETLMLARVPSQGPHLLITHDGDVSVAAPPDKKHFTRTSPT